MSDENNLTRHPPLSPSAVAGRLAVIGGLLFTSALAFAYAGGWLTPDRLTPTRIVAALSDRGGNPLGHRRNHSKGMCFTGVFDANGAYLGTISIPRQPANVAFAGPGKRTLYITAREGLYRVNMLSKGPDRVGK